MTHAPDGFFYQKKPLAGPFYLPGLKRLQSPVGIAGVIGQEVNRHAGFLLLSLVR
jgi:hypothetical protein